MPSITLRKGNAEKLLLSQFPKYIPGKPSLFDFLSYGSNMLLCEALNFLSEFGFRI